LDGINSLETHVQATFWNLTFIADIIKRRSMWNKQ
jgi:hypothetical protein